MIITPESSSEQPGLRVRKATREDVPQIARLVLASLDTSLPGFKFSSLPENELSAVEARQRVRLPPAAQSLCLVDIASGGILGYSVVRSPGPDHPEHKKGEHPELDMFFVKAGMSGRGFGSMLMQTVKERWKDSGLCLRVFTRNMRAIKFYQGRGFAIESEEEDHWVGEGVHKQKEPMYLMRWSPTTSESSTSHPQ